MVWENVLVLGYTVESDGFTVEVGDTLTIALELFCEERRPAGSDERSAGLRAGEYDLVGEVRDVGSQGAWTFAAEGLTFYVIQGTYDPPRVGSRLRVRGGLSIVESHVVDEFDHRDAVLRTAERPFTVRQVVRRQAGRVWDVPAVGRAQPPGSDYLLTLVED